MRESSELYPIYSQMLWQKVSLDITKLPKSNGKEYLVVTRDDFSEWPEAWVLSLASSELVAKFIHEEILTRHDCMEELVVDGGSENKGEVIALGKKFVIKHIITSVYHSQVNGMIEHSHQPITDALFKLCNSEIYKWTIHLNFVLWVD